MSELAAIMARRRKMEEGGEAPSLAAESPKAATGGSSSPAAGGGGGVGSPDLQSAMARRRTMAESGASPAAAGGAASGTAATSTTSASSSSAKRASAKKGGIINKRPPKLYVDGAVLGYKRGQRNQYVHVSLVKIKNVETKADAEFYCGKKIAFITRSKGGKKNKGGEYRVTWGKVCRPHGSNGVVRCRFQRNLPPQAMGGRVRIMLYPSNL